MELVSNALWILEHFLGSALKWWFKDDHTMFSNIICKYSTKWWFKEYQKPNHVNGIWLPLTLSCNFSIDRNSKPEVRRK
jgi:hypothetical protein